MNYELPKKYWEERDPQGKKVEKEKLLGMIEDYIKKHNSSSLSDSMHQGRGKRIRLF